MIDSLKNQQGKINTYSEANEFLMQPRMGRFGTKVRHSRPALLEGSVSHTQAVGGDGAGRFFLSLVMAPTFLKSKQRRTSLSVHSMASTKPTVPGKNPAVIHAMLASLSFVCLLCMTPEIQTGITMSTPAALAILGKNPIPWPPN